MQPHTAVVSELRALLFELSDDLVTGVPHEVLLDTLNRGRHLMELAEMQESLAWMILRDLAVELTTEPELTHRAYYAQQIHHVMDRLMW